jgi:hypothetical protein
MTESLTTELDVDISLPGNVGVSLLGESTIDQVEMYEKTVKDMKLSDVANLNNKGMRDKLCNGMYARVLLIPKGTLVTGALHKKDYIDIFIHGDITVKSYYANGDIEDVERVTFFRFFEGKAGRKRVLIAHEDTLWVTVDPTKCDKIDDAREDIVNISYKDFNQGEEG